MNTVVANLNIEVIKPTIGAIIHNIDLNALNEQTTPCMICNFEFTL
ncbi:hypothetical protein ACFMJL_19825, partial [Acinetobacter baumannii]